MHELLKDCNIPLDVPVKPRKGHLLVTKRVVQKEEIKVSS
jgi:hypothetical protein